MDKWQAISTARKGNFSGVLSLSRFTWDGFRQNSAADIGIYNVGLTWTPTKRSSLDLRVLLANDPLAAESRRAYLRRVQRQPRFGGRREHPARGVRTTSTSNRSSLTYQQRFDSHGGAINVSAFGLKREVQNPLATAPPGDQGADAPIAGVYVQIDAPGRRRACHGRLPPRHQLALTPAHRRPRLPADAG